MSGRIHLLRLKKKKKKCSKLLSCDVQLPSLGRAIQCRLESQTRRRQFGPCNITANSNTCSARILREGKSSYVSKICLGQSYGILNHLFSLQPSFSCSQMSINYKKTINNLKLVYAFYYNTLFLKLLFLYSFFSDMAVFHLSLVLRATAKATECNRTVLYIAFIL